MPLRWVPPAVFVEYKGKKVYHAYNDDNENDPYMYTYTTDEAEEEHYEFELYALRREKKLLLDQELDLNNIDDQRKLIVAAVDAGVLEFPEEDE